MSVPIDDSTFTPTARRAVVIAMMINLLAGAQYCWSLLGGAVGAQNGWTTTQLALPYSIMMVVTSLWTIVVGHVNDKSSKPKYMVMFGAVSLCIGMIVAGTTQSYAVLFLAIVLGMGLASTSFTSNTSGTAVKYAPLRYKGLTAGLVGAGMGWTAFYMAPLIRSLNAAFGITPAFVIIGVGCGGLIFILAQFLPTPPKASGTSPEELAAARAAEQADQNTLYKNTVGFRAALTKRETWALFFMFGCCAMGGQMMTSQMTKLASVQLSTGDAVAVAASMIMSLGLANGLGRLAVATISDKLGIVSTWRLIFAVQGLNILLFRFYHTPLPLVVGAFIVGFFYGAGIPLVWASIAGIFGRKNMASIYGIVTNGFTIGAVGGPLISSTLVDTTGSYHLAFYIMAGFMLTGIICTVTLPSNKEMAGMTAVT